MLAQAKNLLILRTVLFFEGFRLKVTKKMSQAPKSHSRSEMKITIFKVNREEKEAVLPKYLGKHC